MLCPAALLDDCMPMPSPLTSTSWSFSSPTAEYRLLLASNVSSEGDGVASIVEEGRVDRMDVRLLLAAFWIVATSRDDDFEPNCEFDAISQCSGAQPGAQGG